MPFLRVQHELGVDASLAKHFAATKSKVEATKLAIAENPEFHRLLQAGHKIKWAA